MTNSNFFIKQTFYKLLIPTMVTGLFPFIMFFVDTIVVGNVMGEIALAAMAINLPIFMFITSVSILLSVGCSITMSNAESSGDTVSANKSFSLTLMIALVTGSVLATLGLIFLKNLMYICGANSPEIAELAAEYAKITIMIIPILFLNMLIYFVVKKDHNKTLAITSAISTIFINLVLDVVFVSNLRMGLVGSAYATGIAQTLGLIMLCAHFFIKKNTIKFVPSFSLKRAINIFKNGSYVAFSFILQTISFAIINAIAVRFSGLKGLCVCAVIFNCYIIILAVIDGFNRTLQPAVSVYFREKNTDGIKNIQGNILSWGLIVSGVLVLVLEYFPWLITALFGITNLRVLEAGQYAVREFVAAIVFMMINKVMVHHYVATQNQKLALVMESSRNFVMLVLGAFVFAATFGLNGIFASIIFAEVVTTVIWLIAGTIIKNKSKNINSLLLLEEPKENSILMAYMKADPNDLSELLANIEKFLTDNDVDYKKINLVMLSIEELISNIIVFGNEDKVCDVEVRVAIGEKINVSIKDNGKKFDPTEFKSKEDEDVPEYLGLFLVKESSAGFEYAETLGFNSVLLKY